MSEEAMTLRRGVKRHSIESLVSPGNHGNLMSPGNGDDGTFSCKFLKAEPSDDEYGPMLDDNSIESQEKRARINLKKASMNIGAGQCNIRQSDERNDVTDDVESPMSDDAPELSRDLQHDKIASYTEMIAHAIFSSENNMCTLQDVYTYLDEQYPVLKSRGKSWKNSVRHTLSLNEWFVKIPRMDNGKCCYWSVHPVYLQRFKRGDFQKQRKSTLKAAARKAHLRDIDQAGLSPLAPPPGYPTAAGLYGQQPDTSVAGIYPQMFAGWPNIRPFENLQASAALHNAFYCGSSGAATAQAMFSAQHNHAAAAFTDSFAPSPLFPGAYGACVSNNNNNNNNNHKQDSDGESPNSSPEELPSAELGFARSYLDSLKSLGNPIPNFAPPQPSGAAPSFDYAALYGGGLGSLKTESLYANELLKTDAAMYAADDAAAMHLKADASAMYFDMHRHPFDKVINGRPNTLTNI